MHGDWMGFLAWVLLFCAVGSTSGWVDCSISPQDKWKLASERIPAMRMREEYERGYTCRRAAASFMAARFYFDSPCLRKRFFDPPDVQSCLKGRRVIFLGDSVSNQQGDSLVGMLGWHPDWMPRGGPRNTKEGVNEDGTRYYTLVDCWHPAEDRIDGIQRCYDLYGSDFGNSLDEEISVHVRKVTHPYGERWLERAVRDYNETRPSDVFVVNFGAHFPQTPEGDRLFEEYMSPVLDSMARLGENATVAWREIAPTHFPAKDGSYEEFKKLRDHQPRLENSACCTGVPPKVLARNLWVENYLRDHGLTDRVKVLRIYDMSVPRGAAHHTCHLAPPSTMDQEGADSFSCNGFKHDCTHWSETGVIEEWNALLLNHICPAE